MDNYKIAVKVSIITIIANVVLALFKLVAGVIGNSSAMLADGVHTLSDVLTTIIVLIGLKVASKEADDEHPYGHEKYESVFAKILSIMLMLTGLFIGYEAIKILRSGEFGQPGKIALMAAFLSIIVKEIMYRYTIIAAKKIKSTSMEADAWHHRSDSFSSIGTFLGILGARIGIPALDPITGVIVSVFVIKVGVDLYMKSISELVDESASDEILKQIEDKTNSIKGVRGIKSLKTRISGNVIYVDLEILVDGHISVVEGHDISKIVYKKIINEIEDIKYCMVHIEPYD